MNAEEYSEPEKKQSSNVFLEVVVSVFLAVVFVFFLVKFLFF